ncbi:hypothetical protein DesyoDRAFT_3795 [Desulfosporosinus youngiae DSM 17734]|uniref:Uncharacterized protein n=1 Tax=Desulfosporosinus youngiae DSM 17734 TaxID=768710 RepID=H5Y5Q4_9FIRM|nr:hypothetical protein DesyoDRAFT_3795 [Desulfosporosinus youngiae DSM 17734]
MGCNYKLLCKFEEKLNEWECIKEFLNTITDC